MWVLYTDRRDNAITLLSEKQLNIMNDPDDMLVCPSAHSHLFLDGRFTSGAASVWPAESKYDKKITFLSSFLNHRARSFSHY